ncbi:MAG: hypothetical protein A2284_07980 [Deltaproteobacteria bacterium RIFOXYA12_FULL_61_11]|nr:MAG: hypothetical protein A2284_07980 [Deltaproteobacteria bacterium RIFOXYA12_FULL_61_11]
MSTTVLVRWCLLLLLMGACENKVFVENAQRETILATPVAEAQSAGEVLDLMAGTELGGEIYEPKLREILVLGGFTFDDLASPLYVDGESLTLLQRGLAEKRTFTLEKLYQLLPYFGLLLKDEAYQDLGLPTFLTWLERFRTAYPDSGLAAEPRYLLELLFLEAGTTCKPEQRFDVVQALFFYTMVYSLLLVDPAAGSLAVDERVLKFSSLGTTLFGAYPEESKVTGIGLTKGYNLGRVLDGLVLQHDRQGIFLPGIHGDTFPEDALVVAVSFDRDLGPARYQATSLKSLLRYGDTSALGYPGGIASPSVERLILDLQQVGIGGNDTATELDQVVRLCTVFQYVAGEPAFDLAITQALGEVGLTATADTALAVNDPESLATLREEVQASSELTLEQFLRLLPLLGLALRDEAGAPLEVGTSIAWLEAFRASYQTQAFSPEVKLLLDYVFLDLGPRIEGADRLDPLQALFLYVVFQAAVEAGQQRLGPARFFLANPTEGGAVLCPLGDAFLSLAPVPLSLLGVPLGPARSVGMALPCLHSAYEGAPVAMSGMTVGVEGVLKVCIDPTAAPGERVAVDRLATPAGSGEDDPLFELIDDWLGEFDYEDPLGGTGGDFLCGCYEVDAPVCGVDGKTYPNACEADCEEVAIASTGACGQTGQAGSARPCGEADFWPATGACSVLQDGVLFSAVEWVKIGQCTGGIAPPAPGLERCSELFNDLALPLPAE